MTTKKKKENKTPVKGYKVFNNDWTCKGFQYEVGQTYETDKEISLCNAGFHFCKKLEDCFKYYDFVQWNKIAEVEAIGTVINGDDKSVTDKIKIVREIPFNEIADIIKTQNSYGVNGSNGVNWSKGVNGSYGILNCSGISNGLFCNGKHNQYYIFNKEVKKKYWEEVNSKLIEYLNGFTPTFNNLKGLYFKSGSRWEYTPIPNAEELSIKEAWEGMPQKAIDYLKSLPEFNKEMFTKITGIEVNDD